MLIKFTKYLPVLVDIIKKDEIDSNKNRNIRKSRNKLIKILIKLKSWNLLRFKSRNFYKFKNTVKV